MWSVAPDSIAHLEEDEIRHVSSLPNSTSAVVGAEAEFNNLAYSYVEGTTNCSKILLVKAT